MCNKKNKKKIAHATLPDQKKKKKVNKKFIIYTYTKDI